MTCSTNIYRSYTTFQWIKFVWLGYCFFCEFIFTMENCSFPLWILHKDKFHILLFENHTFSLNDVKAKSNFTYFLKTVSKISTMCSLFSVAEKLQDNNFNFNYYDQNNREIPEELLVTIIKNFYSCSHFFIRIANPLIISRLTEFNEMVRLFFNQLKQC